MFLTTTSTQAFPARWEFLLESEFRNEDGPGVYSFEALVDPVDSFSGASGFPAENIIVDDFEGYC